MKLSFCDTCRQFDSCTGVVFVRVNAPTIKEKHQCESTLKTKLSITKYCYFINIQYFSLQHSSGHYVPAFGVNFHLFSLLHYRRSIYYANTEPLRFQLERDHLQLEGLKHFKTETIKVNQPVEFYFELVTSFHPYFSLLFRHRPV